MALVTRTKTPPPAAPAVDPNEQAVTVIAELFAKGNFVTDVLLPAYAERGDAIAAALPEWSSAVDDDDYSVVLVQATMVTLQEAADAAS